MNRTAGRLYAILQGRIVGALTHALPVSAAVLGAVVGASPAKDPWLIGCIGAMLLVERGLTHIRKGSALWQLRAQIGAVNASFAGNLDVLLRELQGSRGSRLDERTSHALCVGLLSRIRRYAEVALGEDRLRATLAVPDGHPQNSSGVGVRVWCYDEPYVERRWTFLPLGVEGAPTALRRREIRIISDLLTVHGVRDGPQRPYRSVVSIPVLLGGPDGEALAVLNLDARRPQVFRQQDIEEKVIPLIQPAMSAIAMVLTLRRPGLAHEFIR